MPHWAPDIGRDTAAQGAESRTGNSPTSFTRRSIGFGLDEAQQCTLESTGKEARTPTRRAQSSRHSEPGISTHVFVTTSVRGGRAPLRGRLQCSARRRVGAIPDGTANRQAVRAGGPVVTDTAVFLGDVGHGGSPGGGAARGPLCGLPRFARRHRVSASWRGTSRRWGEERRVRRTRPRALGGGDRWHGER